MKLKWTALMFTALFCTALTGCGASAGALQENADKFNVVCTNFAEYDWARQLTKGLENQFEITYLLENGVDLHNYQPSAADIAKISTCDLLIYVGGESDHWVPDALQSAVNPDMQVIRLLDVVQALEEETVEGMEAEEEEEEESDAPEYDEHVWLSLRNAAQCCSKISEALRTLEKDPTAAQKLQLNEESYQEQLTALDSEFLEVSTQTQEKPLIFADRFPFRYFVEDYGYTYYAAFPGCSAETEASFETVAFLAQKADETGVSMIFTIEGGSSAVAEAVRDSTAAKNQQIVSLNSLQSVTSDQISEGATYLSLMTDNLNVLKGDAAAT